MSGASPGASAGGDGPFLRVLLTNVWLSDRGGSEIVTRDLALGLLARGHAPVVYSPIVGASGEEIRARGIPVVDDVRQIGEAPDVIHGQHLPPTVEAIVRFPQVPVVNVCHSWSFGVEAPVVFPQVQYYVGVDEACRERIVNTQGVDPMRVRIILNAVDLGRFPDRRAPLGERPLRALTFHKAVAQIVPIRSVCDAMGIQLDALGYSGRNVPDPENHLIRYDLVFATARSALEALCAGCAVVLCDARGMAGPVTSANFRELRKRNFGLRCLTDPVTEGNIAAAIGAYDAADAGRVSRMAREEAALDRHLDAFLLVYRDAVARAAQHPWSEMAHSAALSSFLRVVIPRRRHDLWPQEMRAEEPPVPHDRLAALVSERDALVARCNALDASLASRAADAALRAEAQRLERELEAVTAQRDALVARCNALDASLASRAADAALRAEAQRLESELRSVTAHRDALVASTSWRMTAPVRMMGRIVKRGPH